MNLKGLYAAALAVLVVVFCLQFTNPPEVYGQQVRSGGVTTLFATATLTNVYQFSSSMDLQSYDSIVAMIRVPTTQSGAVAKVKTQWSHDDSLYFDEPILTQGTTASGETPFTVTSRVIQVDMATAAGTNNYIERSRRLARFLRYAVASTNVVTTATLQITATKMLNSN